MPVFKSHILLLFFSIAGFCTAHAQFGKIIFQDSFEDNNRGWPIETNEAISTTIDNGRYVIDKKSTKGAQLIWNNAIKLENQDDYVIEAQVKHIEGNKDYGTGITWAGVDTRNYYAFTVSASGSFAIYKFEEGVFFDIKGNTFLADHIRPSGYWNHLKILKSGNTLTFFINDYQAYTTSFEKTTGSKTGLIVNMDMKILVDDFRISLPAGSGVSQSNIELIWLNPVHPMTTTGEEHLRVEIGVRSEALLHKVSLYFNHVLISRNEGFDLVRGDLDLDEIVTENITLRPGINEIKIIVEDVKGQVVEEKHMVKLEEKVKQTRRDLALLFASDEYDHWTNLINPINDAEVLAAELEKYYGFRVELIRNATSSEVMAKLKEYAKAYYNDYDQLFIFFAGHGKYDDAFKEGYVVCKNSLKDDVGNTSYLAHSSLRTVINNIPCEHVFLIMDVCFGGTFDQSLVHRSSKRGEEDDDVYGELSRKQYIMNKLQYDTRLYLTSGGNEYVPDGRPGFHSPFMRKILEALRSHGGEDKILTFSEILHYLERVQPEPRWGEFGDNEPGSDFMFIVK